MFFLSAEQTWDLDGCMWITLHTQWINLSAWLFSRCQILQISTLHAVRGAFVTLILFNFLAAFNYSHRIDALSFGPWAPGHINPLDGDLVTTDKSIWNFLSYSLISKQYCKLIHLLKIRNQQKNRNMSYESRCTHVGSVILSCSVIN